MYADRDTAAAAARTLQRAEAQTTTCPYCYAPPGEPCFDKKTKTLLVKQPAHLARLKVVTKTEGRDG